MVSGSMAPSTSGDPTEVQFLVAQVLIERGKEIHDLIARRAYEIFERRGHIHGFDIADWLWAESELLYPCRHDLRELCDMFVLKGEVPGSFTRANIALSVEPHRLTVSGERKVDAICGDSEGTHIESVAERIFRIHELPGEIDPSRTTAVLRGNILEVVMPKAAAAGHPMSRRPDL